MFFNVAGFFVILGAEFLAVLFIVVYVGAVAVLFLFIVMMLNIKLISLNLSMYRYIPIFFIFGFIFFSGFYLILYDCLISVNQNQFYLPINFIDFWYIFSFSFDNVGLLSNCLYTYYAYLLIVSGVILLISMIGAISLTLHRRNDIKRQYIYKQIIRDFNNSIVWKV